MAKLLARRNAKVAALEASRKATIAGNKARKLAGQTRGGEVGGVTSGNRVWTCECGREFRGHIGYWNHTQKCHSGFSHTD